MNDEPTPPLSSLCQTIMRGGQSVRVDIYGDGKGQWLLEVVDENNNSTVWDDPFETEQAALSEVLQTIDEEGIQSLIGAPDRSSQH